MSDTTNSLPEELPEDDGLHVLGEEVEQLPVAHLALAPDLVQVHLLLVKGTGPQVHLQKKICLEVARRHDWRLRYIDPNCYLN